MRSLARAAAALTAAYAIWGLAPTSAHAFGTWTDVLSQKAEHERITRTLACGAADNEQFCLQAHSLDQIAGYGRVGLTPGYLGGVGEADSVSETLKGPASKHCDNGDFLPGSYPLSRANATSALKACVDRFQSYMGHAVAQAGNLVDADGRLKNREAALDQKGSGIDDCSIYDSVAGERPSARAKCAVFANLGRAAHIAQDFWSHSNWGDRPEPAPAPIGRGNPPGLNNTGSPDFLRFPMQSMTVPELLATGCDDTGLDSRIPGVSGPCERRVFHGTETGLNKDKGAIDPRSGSATSPITSRGRLYGGANFQAVVTGARMQTRLLYHDFTIATRARYGLDRAREIQRALSLDAPWTSCKHVGGGGKGAFAAPSPLPTGWRDTSVRGSVANRTGLTPVCDSAILDSGEGWGQLPARPGDVGFSAFGQPGGTRGSISFSFPDVDTNVVLRWDNPYIGSSTYKCSSSTPRISCSATKIAGAHGGELRDQPGGGIEERRSRNCRGRTRPIPGHATARPVRSRGRGGSLRRRRGGGAREAGGHRGAPPRGRSRSLW